MFKRIFIFIALLLNLSCIVIAEEMPKDDHSRDILQEQASETLHTLAINGVPISYKAVAGTIVLIDDQKTKKASFFYTAYTKQDTERVEDRPLTFCFNGGPGSSSVWLHMGLMGPKRVVMNNEEGDVSPPYNYVDNEYCLLDLTDLVFIDPVSTGYSRALTVDEAKQYHGVEEDIKSVGEFIRIYTTRANRWLSPKFLCGESYGTTRAAGLAGHLQDEFNMDLNGIILISSVLNFATLDKADAGNDLPYILYLPTFTAAAWYHKKLPKGLQNGSLENAIKQAETFAMNDYLLALMKGSLISQEEKKAVIAKMSSLTGLSENYIAHANLRVKAIRFMKELLRDQDRTIGRFDARIQGIDRDACADSLEHDPCYSGLFGVFTAAYNSYIRSVLKWEKDDEYKVLANVWPWNYGKATNKYLNMADTLRDVLTDNPAIKVFVAAGRYDLATPFFATEYTFNHLFLNPVLGSPVTMCYYDAGHMMYTQKASLVKLHSDLVEYYQNTLKTTHKTWNRFAR